MKKIIKIIVPILFIGLVVINIFIFVSSMSLSQQINSFEKDTQKIRQQNIALEKELYRANSLDYAASVAAKLEFTKKAEPYFLENLKYALNK